MDGTSRSALIITLSAAFLICAAMIFDNYRMEVEGDQIYLEAIEEFVVTRPPETEPASTQQTEPVATDVTSAPHQETAPSIEPVESQTTKAAESRPIITNAEDVEIDFERLMKINSEIIGWIIIENTAVSYPILQAADNDKYLTTTYNNKNSKYGSIFVDYRLKSDFSIRHTLIYGHNMRNSSMFGTLLNFTTKSYWQNRKYFHVITPDGILKYEIFSAYKADVGSDTYAVSFRDRKHYESVLLKMVEWSEVDMGIVPGADDQIVTLCTCTSNSDERDTKRYVVHGRLVSDSRTADSGND